MKLLFVSSDKFPPFRVDVLDLFGKEMLELGHKVDWLLQSDADCSCNHETQWRGCKVYVGRTNNADSLFARIQKHCFSILNDLKLFGIVKKSEYDFVLVKDKFIAAMFALLATKRSPSNFIYWLSYPYPEASLYDAQQGTARFPLLYRIRGHVFDVLLYRFILKAAKHVFVQSEQMKRDLIGRGVTAEKMTAVPMGFSTEAFERWQESKADYKSFGEPDIAYLGTMVGTRKMDFMVRVLAKVKAVRPEARLLFVGDGETKADREMIENEAKKLGVDDSVTITGFMPQLEALNIIKSAKVCVSPFYPTPVLNSTSPTKLIEYMALAKAVVVNDHPEQSQVIAESGGGICVAWNEQAFADAILTLLEDEECRTVMGQKGLNYVKANRTYDRIVSPVEKALMEALNTQV